MHEGIIGASCICVPGNQMKLKQKRTAGQRVGIIIAQLCGVVIGLLFILMLMKLVGL